MKKKKTEEPAGGEDEKKGRSLRVAEADVSADVHQNCRRTHSVSLSPHEFIHVRRDHVCVDPFHSLELRLDPVPV